MPVPLGRVAVGEKKTFLIWFYDTSLIIATKAIRENSLIRGG
jgi:hypothetical protein